MRVVIVCNGMNNFRFNNLNKHDIVIACDGGYQYCKPNIYVGDLDSTTKIDCHEKFIFKREKDQSDLEIALEVIKKYPITQVDIFNATGKRLDHELTNLRLLAKIRDPKVRIIDDHNIIYMKNESFTIEKNDYQYISFFNVDENTVISLKGFKYELTDYEMKPLDTLCLSNEIIDVGHVTINKPILVIQSRD